MINSFTIGKHKEEIIADVKKEIEEVAAEDTPKVKKAVNKTSKAKK